MSTVDNLIAEASRLSITDRLRLIEAISETVPEEHSMTLSPEWMAEIERRSAEYDAGRMPTVSLEDVMAAATNRLPKDQQ